MTPATGSSGQADAALAAFVRGIERRGLVLAEAQCGDPARAQAAVSASKHTFLAHAAGLPLMRWPPLFWQLLLAQPVLRTAAVPVAGDVLSTLSSGPRAALLLRLVAGLDNEHGAEVLRVSAEAYRHALYSALLALQKQGIDEASVRVLRDRLQQRINGSSAVRAADPARHALPVRIGPSDEDAAAPLAPPWLRPALIAVLALLLATFIGSFAWLPAFLKTGTQNGRFEQLGAQAPAATLSATATALAGSDFRLLDDPDGERIARDLDVYAWYAAGPDAVAPIPNGPVPLPESTAPETSMPDAEADPTENAGAQ